MKTDRQRVQVLEDFQCECPHGVLRYTRKERVAQLIQCQRGQPEDSVGEKDGKWDSEPQIGFVIKVAESVYRITQYQRYHDIGRFGEQQTQHGDKYPSFEISALGRPEERQESGKSPE